MTIFLFASILLLQTANAFAPTMTTAGLTMNSSAAQTDDTRILLIIFGIILLVNILAVFLD